MHLNHQWFARKKRAKRFVEEVNRVAERLLDDAHCQQFHTWLKDHTGDQGIITNGRANGRLVDWLLQQENAKFKMEIKIICTEVYWWYFQMVKNGKVEWEDEILIGRRPCHSHPKRTENGEDKREI